jgi:hypothetical protein
MNTFLISVLHVLKLLNFGSCLLVSHLLILRLTILCLRPLNGKKRFEKYRSHYQVTLKTTIFIYTVVLT